MNWQPPPPQPWRQDPVAVTSCYLVDFRLWIKQMNDLVAQAYGAVVETEEVYQLVQKLADADRGDVHRAAQRLPQNTRYFEMDNITESWRAGGHSHTQKKSSLTRMANLWRRSRNTRTGEKESSATQRLTPASWPQISSCWSSAVWQKTHVKSRKYMGRNIGWFRRTPSRK